MLQPDFGADLIKALTGREPMMEPTTVAELQEIIAEHIREEWEAHLRDIDRTFDRLARRLLEAEQSIAAFELKIAESELAIRKNVDELLRRQ